MSKKNREKKRRIKNMQRQGKTIPRSSGGPGSTNVNKPAGRSSSSGGGGGG